MDVFARNSSGNILASGSASGSIVRINVDVPAWDQLGQRNGYQFVKAVDIIKDQFSYYNYSGGSTGSVSSQISKWWGGVLAPNGCVYGVPYGASSSIKIDTNNQFGAITFVGSGSFTPGGGGWIGGSLGGDGRIYCAPKGVTNILVINPNTDTMSTIPALANYQGAVTANDGSVYFIPYGATAVGKFDVSRGIFTSFGIITGTNKYFGGVLAPNNGFIYFVPFDAAVILKINPVTDQITTFGSFPAGGNKWAGGVLGPNGLIYCIPNNSTGSLIINPFNDTYVISGSISSGTNKYQGGALGLDGNIYAFGYSPANYLKINTTTNTLTEISTAVISRIGSVLGANGNIYGIPLNATSVGLLSMNVSASVDINIPLSRYINKS